MSLGKTSIRMLSHIRIQILQLANAEMHCCFCIHEIIELIARFAEKDASGSCIQRALNSSVALALTCRTLYEPASNIRWRRLDLFAPLLRLFLVNCTLSSAATPTGAMTVKSQPHTGYIPVIVRKRIFFPGGVGVTLPAYSNVV